jgi:PiT family inorganic phosphate transporter
MYMITPIVLCVVVFALVFEFINGFHDTANAIATSVYTRALSVRNAIILAAVMNFTGALVSDGVAKTISHGLVNVNLQEYVVLAALIGAIIWNLITWWIGIPSSSSHALIGSLIGATMIYTMSGSHIIWSGIMEKVIIPLFTSPMLGILLGFSLMKLIFALFASWTPQRVNKVFSKLQILSAALVAFSHGMNDAQKTMGIITLSLITGNLLPADADVPLVVKIMCAIMIMAGTSVGGWRIMKTMGGGVTKLTPAGGFAAQTSSAAIILTMSFLHAPISTTHVITTSVMGVGSAKRISAVKWSAAKDIILTWVITLPATAILGGFCCLLIKVFVG